MTTGLRRAQTENDTVDTNTTLPWFIYICGFSLVLVHSGGIVRVYHCQSQATRLDRLSLTCVESFHRLGFRHATIVQMCVVAAA